ncbi:MAG: GAF domain-containing protein [Chloroflexi bacterium]|uniref:histidine kinase n=1 Tax=Candidatus Chlorohelix allophototropha TaxID=3003348 RepID=A0A8T7M430_9CHLR|nr:GAF domain-containing protein [Chloroflexota bacterium]WJW70192.1 GAF domain-containing protein [Chloroflexota bacterium L227-S17]
MTIGKGAEPVTTYSTNSDNFEELYCQLLDINQQQSMLLDMSRELSANLSLEEVISQLLKYAQRFFNTDGIRIGVAPELNIDYASLEQNQLLFELAPESRFINDGVGLIAQAYHSGEICYTKDYINEPDISHHIKLDVLAKKLNVVASLVAPIKLNDKVVSVLWLSKNSVYEWKPEEIERVARFSATASAVLGNAKLYHDLYNSRLQLQRRNRELEERNLDFETLQDFNKRLRGPLELKPTAERALNLVLEMIKANAGAVYLVRDNDPQQLELLVSTHRYDSNIKLSKIEWEKAILPADILFSKVSTSRKSKLVNDLSKIWRKYATGEPRPSWRSAIVIPLFDGKAPIGVMGLIGVNPNQFNEDQLNFCEMAGNQIAAAIVRVSHIEIQKEQEKLASVLALARTAAHEINQPLTILQGELELIGITRKHPSEETMQCMLKAIREISQRIRAYQQIMEINMVESAPGINTLETSR